MCIGQDVRGNIKLSLKAALPQAGSEKKNLESQDSVPTKQEVSVWASVENVPICQEDQDSEVEPATNSTPAVVIRSAAECDAQDIAAGQHSIKKSGKGTKTSPRPYNASSKHWNDFGSTTTKRKPVSSPNQTQMKKENKRKDYCGRKPETDSRPGNLLHALMQNDADVKPKSFGSTSLRAGSLKLGDQVIAKIYQIRTHGLVLELGGGVRGMYKFEVLSIFDGVSLFNMVSIAFESVIWIRDTMS